MYSDAIFSYPCSTDGPQDGGYDPGTPEPLQAFRGVAEAVSPALWDVEESLARYREERDAGRILANSVEALRVELTYHSNAIEGSTLSLRETQLVLEGYFAARRQDAP